jgi:pyruvate,orthophosphate dikinase
MPDMARGQHIYRFSVGIQDGDGSMKAELGGKGAALAEMARLGVPVPPGFTISTAACRHYLKHGEFPASLRHELQQAMQWLESEHEKGFNDAANPLLVSVRSGAAVSMPGMMDTILNVGLNRETLRGLAVGGGSPRFAYDSYRRLAQMFGSVVLGVPKKRFDAALQDALRAANAASEADLGAASLEELAGRFEAIIEECKGEQFNGAAFPADPGKQLEMAIEAVFSSWRNERARYYRRLNHISEDAGTAVTVQAMAFGNMGPNSGTGVGFTRNPSTGEAALFGEFLAEAQGEDIVAGVRTPMPLAELSHTMPAVYHEICSIAARLECHYRDAQDFELTVERGKLYLLQTRSAKRSTMAAVRIAVEMAEEGLISKLEAIRRVDPSRIDEVLCARIDLSGVPPDCVAQGLAASPGAVAGRIALSAERAVAAAANGNGPVILVAEETTAEDIHGMAASVGFLTACGGATSHAAVVARGMGKCCVTGAKDLHVEEGSGTVRMGAHWFAEGDWLTLDGSSGRVYAGRLPLRDPGREANVHLGALRAWAIEWSAGSVRANADTPEDACAAFRAGAAGIGLCRTEHMFFAPERLRHVREMILAADTVERNRALAHLLPMQQADFERIYRAMHGLPVTVRLLDPPLHEFLPAAKDLARDLAAAVARQDDDAADALRALLERVGELAESNPMMGHRGCRLSVTYPEILTMQVGALLRAAITVADEGCDIHPEIMVPLVACAEEIAFLRRLIDKTAEDVFQSCGRRLRYSVGTMIELPRAAVCADTLAPFVDFVSFGTNDLTQMAFGFSRDDSRRFLDDYIEKQILSADPFLTIDVAGVGGLVRMAVEKLRAVKPGVKIGVCGEHAGDPASIRFFASAGVDYISCSPARLAAAQLAMAQTLREPAMGAAAKSDSPTLEHAGAA